MKQLLLLLFFFSLSFPVLGQNSGDSAAVFTPEFKPGVKYLIKTNIGTVHSGFVVKETKDFITLEYRSTQDRMDIRKSEILSYKVLSQRENKVADVLGENEHADAYILASSAFLFDPESSRSNTHWLLIENMDYAFNENWAITVNSFAFYPVSLGVKGHFKIDDLNYIGGNVFVMGDILAKTSSRSAIGLWGFNGFAKYTHGTTNNHFTVTGGVLGINSELLPGLTTAPFVNLGFANVSYCNRFAKHASVNVEAWFFPQSESGLGGLSVKWLRDENLAWNFGCYMFIENYAISLAPSLSTMPIPYIGYYRKFN